MPGELRDRPRLHGGRCAGRERRAGGGLGASHQSPVTDHRSPTPAQPARTSSHLQKQRAHESWNATSRKRERIISSDKTFSAPASMSKSTSTAGPVPTSVVKKQA